MKPVMIICVGLVLVTATPGTADAWRGAVGPRGGAAVAGPRGAAVRGPYGGAAAVGRYGGPRCAGLVVTSQSGAATVARITVADGGMVPVPSLLGWQSVPPLVPQQPPHIIIIMAVPPVLLSATLLAPYGR